MAASAYMRVCRTILRLFLGTLIITKGIIGYSTGAQRDSCTSLTVDHVDGNGNLIPTRTSPSPFTIQVLSPDFVYRENRAVKVLINVPAGTQFNGFVLQARDTETSTPVGEWGSLFTDGTKTISCTSENDTITHSSNLAVTSTLELQWKPSQNYGQVQFVLSIAQDYNVFWNNIMSQPLSFDGTPIFYFGQSEITLIEGGPTMYLDICVNIPTPEPVFVALTFTEGTANTADIRSPSTYIQVSLPINFLCLPYGLSAINNDGEENPEVLFLTISRVDGNGVIDETAATANISIIEFSDDIEISISDNNNGGNLAILEVSEGDGEALIEVCASKTLIEAVFVEFTVERVINTSVPVTQDITFVSPVTIPASQTCAYITIETIQDTITEDDELFVITLTSSSPVGDIMPTGRNILLRLVNSAPDVVGIDITSQALNLREDIGSALIQVCASRIVDEDLTIAFDIISVLSGDPVSDDIIFTSPLTISSGTMCNFINITIVPDNIMEVPETFILTLTSAVPIVVLRQSSVIVTVMDVQEPTTGPPAITITPEISVREDANRTSFQICANPMSSNAITIGLQTETVSSAAGGISVDPSVTIPSGVDCVQHEVVIQDDDIPESGEQYTIRITFVPLPNTIGNASQLSLTIQDNDSPCSSLPCLNDGTCVTQEDQSFVCLCSYGFTGLTCSDEEMFLPVSISPSSLRVTEGGNGTLTVCYPGVQTTTSVSLSTNLQTAEQEDITGSLPIGDFTLQLNSSQECTSLYLSADEDDQFEGNETLLVTILSVSTASTLRLDERQITATVTLSDKGDPCMSNPCENSGICSISLSGDTVSVVCTCTDAWTGVNCENAVVCLANPCQNGATCEPVQDGSDYQCTNCSSMYEGKDCDTFLPCSTNPCRNGGSCTNLRDLGYECTCTSEFAGRDCTFNNPCLSNPCENGDCIARDDGQFECRCLSGFFGALCRMPESCIISPCQNGGRCMPNGPDPADFACVCTRGYMGSRCHLVDHCAFGGCLNGGTCRTELDTFSCECPSGFEGPTCNIRIVPFNPGPCFGVTCENGGTCIESNNNFTCNCPRGWTGQTCTTRRPCTADEDNPPCQNNGICFQTLTSTTCQCTAGFAGSLCEFEIPTEPGDNACEPNPCQNGGSCFPLDNGNYVCTCLSILFSGAYCENCRCKNGGTCGVERCICPENTSGEFCENHRACNNIACNNGGTCSVQENVPFCQCRDGFLGDRCEIVDRCTGVTCSNGGTCQQSDGKCSCSVGFEGDTCSIQSQSLNASPDLSASIFCFLILCSVTLLLTLE